MNKLTKTFYRIRGCYPAWIAGRRYKLDPDHIGFWARAASGEWEPRTFRILSKLLDKDSVYCDVGAWIGPTVLHAAHICRRVICFEPDPVAYRYLCRNVELNHLHNVTTYALALSDTVAVASMSSFGGRLGDSMSSLLPQGAGAESVEVQQVPWSVLTRSVDLEIPDLMKIDIEGGEFRLLPALRDYLEEHRPILYLSTHSPYLAPDQRLAAMRSLVDALAFYGHCLNDELEAIDIAELTSDDGINNYRSYVFRD